MRKVESYPYFTDIETDSEKSSNFPNIIQLENDGVRIQYQTLVVAKLVDC